MNNNSNSCNNNNNNNSNYNNYNNNAPLHLNRFMISSLKHPLPAATCTNHQNPNPQTQISNIKPKTQNFKPKTLNPNS